MSKKIVIAFEGIEGSGKTFHIDNVSKYLKRKKIPHIKIREPGGNKNSEKIRKLILDKKSNFFSMFCNVLHVRVCVCDGLCRMEDV